VVGRSKNSSHVDPVGPPLGGAPVTVRENPQEQRDKSAIVHIQSILVLARIKRNIFRTLLIAALILLYILARMRWHTGFQSAPLRIPNWNPVQSSDRQNE
jgi:hypothetical protein